MRAQDLEAFVGGGRGEFVDHPPARLVPGRLRGRPEACGEHLTLAGVVVPLPSGQCCSKIQSVPLDAPIELPLLLVTEADAQHRNLSPAKALGVPIPRSLLLRADQVIE